MRVRAPAVLVSALVACGAEHDRGSPDAAPSADARGTGGASEPRCASDVPAAFRALPEMLGAERYLAANNDGVIPWPRYTSSSENLFGVGEHFQSIQRTGGHLIVTGGVRNGTRVSQLIVVEMGSRRTSGAWNLPMYGFDYRDPAPADRVVAVVDIDPERWHAGGFQIAGDIAAVPLYGDAQGSEIRLFDVADPEHPRPIAGGIERGTEISYAAALTRRIDGRYWLLAWDDVDLELYRSVTDDARDGFETATQTVDLDQVEGGFQGGGCGLSGCGTYQNLNFVRQCDGQLFVVGARNTQKAAPNLPGDDVVSLYRVDGETTGDPVALSLVDRREIACADRCNFAAGTGVYVDDPDHLSLYATAHWLSDGNQRFSFNEYSYP